MRKVLFFIWKAVYRRGEKERRRRCLSFFSRQNAPENHKAQRSALLVAGGRLYDRIK